MSGEAVKRLDRLAPTFGTCLRIRLGMDIAKYNSPLNSTGGISGGGGLGGNKLKSGKAPKRTDRLTPTSEHVCGFIWEWTWAKNNSPHDTARLHFGGGGFRESTIQRPGKCGQMAGPIGNKYCTYNACESGNGHRLNKLAP